MIRTLDATRLNAVVNHPDVRPWLGGSGEIDLSEVIADPANITLETEHGGYILARHPYMHGVYEAHSQFLPEGRGEEAAKARDEGFRWLFTHTDCIEVITRVPSSNRAALAYTKQSGFLPTFVQDGAFRDSAGEVQDNHFFSLPLIRWAMLDEQTLADGHAFHEALEAAKAKAGSERVAHADCDAHDRIVGAAFAMIRAGNTRKAIAFYNGWSTVTGYEPLQLLSEFPPVLDVQDAIVTLRDGELSFLKVR
jgi:hypothetical protein